MRNHFTLIMAIVALALVAGGMHSVEPTVEGSNAPIRVLVNESSVMRLLSPRNDAEPARLLCTPLNLDMNQQNVLPMPGLQVGSLRGNAIPIDWDNGKLMYVSMQLQDAQLRVGSGIVLISINDLEHYAERNLEIIRNIQPKETICGLGHLRSKVKAMVAQDGSQVWFDVVQVASKQYLVLSFTDGVLEIQSYDMAAEAIADRSYRVLARLSTDCAGPFFALHQGGRTFVVTANGTVSEFDVASGLTAIGEFRDLRQNKLSARHVIVRDRRTGAALILKREGDDLRPLLFTPAKPENPNPFASELDPNLAKAILTSLTAPQE